MDKYNSNWIRGILYKVNIFTVSKIFRICCAKPFNTDAELNLPKGTCLAFQGELMTTPTAEFNLFSPTMALIPSSHRLIHSCLKEMPMNSSSCCITRFLTASLLFLRTRCESLPRERVGGLCKGTVGLRKCPLLACRDSELLKVP